MALTTWAATDSHDVIQCRKIINDLIEENVRVILQWIPSHCGLSGNEEAERLAKLSANMTQPEGSIPFETTRRICRTKAKKRTAELHITQSQGKRWAILRDNVLPNNLPRSVAVACFRLVTGHDYLQAHLFKIGVVNNPNCALCGDGHMTGDHLFECEALSRLTATTDELSSRAKIYWAARHLMAERQ
ncbi:uncharacterized protein [Rhodnius prolixus]|uniref:uncharacterized protein n=1 Tax=Rhodnius prolixus TaxID=13249 RepID=UPI003D18B61B